MNSQYSSSPGTPGEGRKRSLTRGFTLIELLTVIGIISVLLAILLPALSAARQAAQSVQCLSNLRQMALAAHSYATVYGGHYPIAQYSAFNAPWAVSYGWDFTVMYNTATAQRQVVPGLLWLGQTDARIQQCPSFQGRSNALYDPYTGYNYNVSYIGHGEGESIVAPAKASQVRQPWRCAMFGDGQFISGANKYMRAPLPNPGDASFSSRWGGSQGFRHRGRTNVAFADGHAESLKERFTAGYVLPVNVGFLSEDNSMYGG
jgi:prepilin-type N-terminal cleavage/methylation domain-containing protein/prepilin-type processing-associated H-X9-DG protein